jgi:hypothetical protein
MARRDPPIGYERHHLDPNLIRRLPPRSAAEAMWPRHPSQIATRDAGLRGQVEYQPPKDLIPNHKRGGISPLGGVASIKGASK